ncbi:MAG: hypothetical protein U1E77_18765 [Inhella sp.]
MQALLALRENRLGEAQEQAQRLARALEQPDADLEVGVLVIALWRRVQDAGGRWAGEAVVQRLALRATASAGQHRGAGGHGRGLTAPWPSCCAARTTVFEIAEQALTLSLRGRPEQAVHLLAEQGGPRAMPS